MYCVPVTFFIWMTGLCWWAAGGTRKGYSWVALTALWWNLHLVGQWFSNIFFRSTYSFLDKILHRNLMDPHTIPSPTQPQLLKHLCVTMSVNNGEPLVWLDWRFKMIITMVAWRCFEGWRRRMLDGMQRDQLWISVSVVSLIWFDGRYLVIIQGHTLFRLGFNSRGYSYT